MTNLVGPIPDSKGDVITTTNNGQGFNTLLANVQDGNGNNSAILLSTQQFKISGGYLVNRTPVTAATYTVLLTDYIIAITANSAGVTINLPSPTSQNIGQLFIIQDEVGNANVGGHNITIQVTGGANIDGSPTLILNTAYGAFTLYSNGTQYFAII